MTPKGIFVILALLSLSCTDAATTTRSHRLSRVLDVPKAPISFSTRLPVLAALSASVDSFALSIPLELDYTTVEQLANKQVLQAQIESDVALVLGMPSRRVSAVSFTDGADVTASMIVTGDAADHRSVHAILLQLWEVSQDSTSEFFTETVTLKYYDTKQPIYVTYAGQKYTLYAAVEALNLVSQSSTGSSSSIETSWGSTSSVFLPDGTLVVTLKLAIDYDSITADDTSKSNFISSVTTSICAALNVSSSRVVIISVVPGSVEVTFGVEPDSSDSRSVSDLSTDLTTALLAGASGLLSSVDTSSAVTVVESATETTSSLVTTTSLLSVPAASNLVTVSADATSAATMSSVSSMIAVAAAVVAVYLQ